MSTIDINDVVVVGPGGPLTVSGVTTNPAVDGNPVSATYTVSAPGGTWDPADDGTYNVQLVSSQVADVVGGFAPGDVSVGTFEVDSTLLLLEDFEDNDLTFIPSDPLFYAGGSHFTITPLNGVATPIDPYVGFGGDNFFAAENIDAGPGGGTQTLTFSVDIANRENLNFEGLVAVGGNTNSPLSYDDEESLLIRASIDGNPFQNLFAFEAEEPGGDTTNNVIREDTNFDGIGDGFLGTSTATPISEPITGTGTTLTLEVTVTSTDAQLRICIR